MIGAPSAAVRAVAERHGISFAQAHAIGEYLSDNAILHDGGTYSIARDEDWDDHIFVRFSTADGAWFTELIIDADGTYE